MEKYLTLILLAAPGFIAARIALVLGLTSAKKGEIDSLAGYLSYSFFAVLVTIIISAATGIIDLSGSWQDFTGKFSSVDFTIKMLFITLFSGVIVGSSWALVGQRLFMNFFNKLNVLTGRNIKSTGGSLLNRIFNDGKEHFIIVRKDGKKIAAGFIFAASDPFDDKSELVITEYPEYDAELKRVENFPDRPSYLRNVLRTYVDIENSLVITETEYPPEWCPTLNSQVSTAAKVQDAASA